MKKTKQQLEQEIVSLNNRLNNLYERYDKEREENKNNRNRQINDLNNSFGAERHLSEKLLEIIRWQINPETTKFPFDRDKNQKSENDKYREIY